MSKEKIKLEKKKIRDLILNNRLCKTKKRIHIDWIIIMRLDYKFLFKTKKYT